MTFLTIAGLAVLFIFSALFLKTGSCSCSTNQQKQSSSPDTSSKYNIQPVQEGKIIDATVNPDNKVVNTIPKLVDLGATKCIPCIKMAPILEELKKGYAGIFDVEFIDVWQKENAKKAEEFKVESIPTQVFLDPKGKELWRHVGFFSKEEILAKWKELGYDYKPKEPVTGGQ